MTMEDFYGEYQGPRFWCASLWSDEERPDDWKKIIHRANGILMSINQAGHRCRADQDQITRKMNTASEIFWSLYQEARDIDLAISAGLIILLGRKGDGGV